VSGTAPATCTLVWAAAAYPSGGTLGGRQNEYSTHTYRGCYLIQVTVVVTYTPWTPLVAKLFPAGGIVIKSTTATIAEY
jgi:hypothetical protein